MLAEPSHTGILVGQILLLHRAGVLLQFHASIRINAINLGKCALVAAECRLGVLRKRSACALLLTIVDTALHGVIHIWHEKLSNLSHAQIPEKSFCWARLPYRLPIVLVADWLKFDHALALP